MTNRFLLSLVASSFIQGFVFLTDARTNVTVDGKTEQRGGKAGEVHQRPAERHAVENLSNTPYESIIVELKRKH